MARARMTDRMERLTARLDKIAGELEAVDPRLALALDRVSDRLEGREAGDPPSKVRPGRHITDNEIVKQFFNIIEKSQTGGPVDEDEDIKGVFKDIEDLASDYDYGDKDIYKKFYQGWGRDDFKKLLKYFTDLKTRRILPPHP